MTNDVPDQIWAAPGHDCPWNEGVWDLVDDGDENALFLRATTARIHAEGLVEALALILPLAKGYAAQNKVGSNAEYVATAEALLARIGQESSK